MRYGAAHTRVTKPKLSQQHIFPRKNMEYENAQQSYRTNVALLLVFIPETHPYGLLLRPGCYLSIAKNNTFSN